METKLVAEALDHFAVADPQMHEICRRAFNADAPPRLPQAKSPRAYFPTLVNSIVSQQISTKAAAAIFARLQEQVPLVPQTVAAIEESVIRECGVTKQKARYIVALADSWPTLAPAEFTSLEDAEIITRLSACYGIGRWTAEMFLMFALARPDIFSVGDLGLRQRVAQHYAVEPGALADIRAIAAVWSPYRTVASLSLWHEIDNGPVLL